MIFNKGNLIIPNRFYYGCTYHGIGIRIGIFLPIILFLAMATTGQVRIGFSTQDTVCVNTAVNISNTTTGATSYFWNFCAADLSVTTPVGVNLGNISGQFSNPVFMDYAFYEGNYYGFSTNYNPGNLIRMDFGNSLLNTPTAVNLGNFGEIIPPGPGAEGIQIIENEGKWYAIIVGGYTPSGSEPRVCKIEFGADLTNMAPTPTNWSNIGNLLQPIDLHVFKEGNNWYGLTANAENNTITRFNFTNSFDNTPTAINLGNVGNLEYPTGIYAINDNGFWRVFVVNGGLNDNTAPSGNYSLTRLDFGSSLLNTPTGVNLGSLGNGLNHPRDITIMKSCDQVIGFAVNGNSNANSLVKLDFNNNLSSTPVLTSLGNTGNLNFPHSISRLFRVGNDIYGFITNVVNGTLTRLQFKGCNNSSTPNSDLKDPDPIRYNSPGVYNINLLVDVGLPTQTTLCRNVVVVPVQGASLQTRTACRGDDIVLTAARDAPSFSWNTGSTARSVKAISSGIYWVEYAKFNCIVRDSFRIVLKESPSITARTDTSVCSGDSVRLVVSGKPSYGYSWDPAPGLADPRIASPNASPASTTAYNITATDPSGCVARETIIINVLRSPLFTVSGDTTICKGDTIQLRIASNETLRYRWTYSETLSDLTVPNPLASPLVPTTYHIRVTNVNTCSREDSVLVAPSLQPEIHTIADAFLCEGSSIQLVSSASSEVTDLSWSPAIGISDPNTLSPDASPASTTTYILTAGNSGCNAADSVTITVNPVPVITITVDSTICPNDALQLTAGGGVQYEWYPSRGLSATNIPAPVTTTDYTITYFVKVTGSNTCSAVDSTRVNVSPIPNFSITPANRSVCIGDTARLTAGGGDTYKWISGVIGDPASPAIIVAPQSTTAYQVVITESGCNISDTLSALISVNPLPTIAVSKSNDIDCVLGQATLTGSGAAIYTWFPANGLSANFINKPVVSPSQTTTYHVLGKSAFGCLSEDSIQVKVDFSSTSNGYLVANAFTPNDDGMNDCFRIKNWGRVTGFEMTVYNRWGEKVYFTNNPTSCWDGTYKGNRQQSGVFVYQIRAVTECGTVYRKGTVLLIR